MLPQGTLPPEFSSLAQLKYLNLLSNELTVGRNLHVRCVSLAVSSMAH